ncbi:MAG: hypothetical protein ABEH83_12225, partial [Halobacterium sp.]
SSDGAAAAGAASSTSTEDAGDSDAADAGDGPAADSHEESTDDQAASSAATDQGTQTESARTTKAATRESAADASEAADEGPAADAGASETTATASASTDDRSESTESSPSSEGTSGSADADDAAETPATGEARTGDPDRMFDEEEQWRNATSVPTLDPEKSESTDGGAKAQSSQSAPAERKRAERSSKASSSKQSASGGSRQSTGGSARSTVDKLKRAVKQRDAKLEEASDRIETLQAERDDLQSRVESLETERDDLQAEVDELQAALDAAESNDGTDERAAGTELTPEAALSGTNLFVRYHSKGKPTLDGLDADTDPDAVNDNLRIDHHTQFDAADATVDGEDFEAFLEASAAYRFVSWAVRELPYEIRDAGHANGLADLYDAIPDVDRAELDGTVEVDGEDGPVTQTFDVVLRDRMGNPLVVAELNAEREPVTGHEMDDLVDAATAVREGADELAAAMYVTASFFEPAALETAAEETGGGGFLSRSDKESFVNVGRKSGYHLCLVEDRNDAFHVTVPEL